MFFFIIYKLFYYRSQHHHYQQFIDSTNGLGAPKLSLSANHGVQFFWSIFLSYQ